MVKKGLYILLIGMLISSVSLLSGCRRHSHGHMVEFHKTLTPAQKEKLVAKIETFKKWHHRDLE